MSDLQKHPNLLFDEKDIARIQRNIEKYDWAGRLFGRIRTAVDGDEDAYPAHERRYTMQYPEPDLSSFPDEGINRGVQYLHNTRLMDFALVAALSGERKYSQRLVELLSVMAEVVVRGNDLTQWSQLVNWTTGGDASEMLVAYDLVYNDPAWTPEARNKVESAFKTVMEQILGEPSARHLVNTGFYFQVYEVLCGCFFGREDWIKEGVEGRGGLKDALTAPSPREATRGMRWYELGGGDSPHAHVQRLGRGTADGMFWNETGIYGSINLAWYTWIAEAMLHHDGTNLYEYEAPGGGSIRNCFRSFIERAFSDGGFVLFGQNGMYDRRHPENRKLADKSPNKRLTGQLFDLAYLRYRDPEFGWAALVNPARDNYKSKWGCDALWHGLDASEMEVAPPDVGRLRDGGRPARRAQPQLPGVQDRHGAEHRGAGLLGLRDPRSGRALGRCDLPGASGPVRFHPARLRADNRARPVQPLGLRRAPGRPGSHALLLFLIRSQHVGGGPT